MSHDISAKQLDIDLIRNRKPLPTVTHFECFSLQKLLVHPIRKQNTYKTATFNEHMQSKELLYINFVSLVFDPI